MGFGKVDQVTSVPAKSTTPYLVNSHPVYFKTRSSLEIGLTGHQVDLTNLVEFKNINKKFPTRAQLLSS